MSGNERSGRKPVGTAAKTANFNTRLDPDLRWHMEAFAKASDQSLSQAAEMLIRLGLEHVLVKALLQKR